MAGPHDEAKVHVTQDFTVSADTLWKVLGDFSDLSWVPAVHHHEFEGEGPGMLRHMYLDETTAIVEKLEVLDEENKTISYSIPVNNPLPVDDYFATMTIDETGADSCRLEWSCTWSAPRDMTEEEAVESVTAFYGSLLPGIEEAAGA